jgi:hypothetical protein
MKHLGTDLSFGLNSAAETVSFTKDGSIIIGGFTNSPTLYDQLKFKPEGLVADGINFIAKIKSN